MLGDMGPVSCRDCNIKAVTLSGCRLPQVTPCQLQKEILSFQELKTPRGSISSDLNAMRASLSVAVAGEVLNRRIITWKNNMNPFRSFICLKGWDVLCYDLLGEERFKQVM